MCEKRGRITILTSSMLGLVIHCEQDSKGECVQIKSIQYKGQRKTFVISDPKRENVFSEKMWLQCLEKTKVAKRDMVVIKWKETGETICAAVEGFSLSNVMEVKPFQTHQEKITAKEYSATSETFNDMAKRYGFNL